MATIAEKMVASLKVLQALQEDKNCVVLKGTKEISRTHLNRLLKSGYLLEVMKGWYISSRPGSEGDTTVWYTSYWYFLAKYATERFGDKWCLTPEQSLDIHSGKTTIPAQSIIRSPNGNNNIIKLMYNTSLFDLKADIPQKIVKHQQYGVNMYSLPEGIVYASPSYFQTEELAARTCLSMVKDASDIIKILTENGASLRAGRIAGAFRNIGNDKIADSIMQFMTRLGYKVVEEDPFSHYPSTPITFQISPYATRLRLMWDNMRKTVMSLFPEAPGMDADIEGYLKSVDERYTEDAYHSLSIEGYKVSPELIAKVGAGDWKPDREDKEHKNALIARGYYQAFQEVKHTIIDILRGKNPSKAIEEDHGNWYFEMWSPFVNANILSPTDLVGYRTEQVYIRGSLHIPLPPTAINDAMAVLFDLLKNEPNPAVKAVLGHFFFVFIHPYMDGNGRIGRFILNVMLASGGYNWTIIPVERRTEYMQALEKASVEGDISDFTKIIASLVS